MTGKLGAFRLKIQWNLCPKLTRCPGPLGGVWVEGRRALCVPTKDTPPFRFKTPLAWPIILS